MERSKIRCQANPAGVPHSQSQSPHSGLKPHRAHRNKVSLALVYGPQNRVRRKLSRPDNESRGKPICKLTTTTAIIHEQFQLTGADNPGQDSNCYRPCGPRFPDSVYSLFQRSKGWAIGPGKP